MLHIMFIIKKIYIKKANTIQLKFLALKQSAHNLEIKLWSLQS